MPNGTADGVRWLDVGPERLASWLESFSQRHGGELITEPGPAVITFRCADGAAAECHVPFPPLRGVPGGRPPGAAPRGVPGGRPPGAAPRGVPGGRPPGAAPRGVPGDRPAGAPPPDGAGEPAGVAESAELIRAHALAARTVGVLLVRLGGYAAGVFTGPSAHLAASKVGSRLVHGRSAAG